MADKREAKKKIKEVREIVKHNRKMQREEEIEDHNGKPFTSHNTPTPKTKYNRKKMKKVGRDEY
ncbi:MAG: hypothetical protein IJZ59_02210 [Alphaproteobacteria bacterium]|nr:hypothetical protein [Alphaproteobacteria bacterium]